MPSTAIRVHTDGATLATMDGSIVLGVTRTDPRYEIAGAGGGGTAVPILGTTGWYRLDSSLALIVWQPAPDITISLRISHADITIDDALDIARSIHLIPADEWKDRYQM